jgi:hypothetical protein
MHGSSIPYGLLLHLEITATERVQLGVWQKYAVSYSTEKEERKKNHSGISCELDRTASENNTIGC